MNYKLINNKKMTSTFIKEDYFPAIIEFSSEELNNLFIEFVYRETDMFELSVNPDTNLLKRFSLTLCNHYRFEEMSISIPEYEESCITIYGSDKTECDCFLAIIYPNGIKIELSNISPAKHIKCGQLIFSFTDKNELAAVYITELSEDEIKHTKFELSSK